jgi:hypothetical protein
VVVVVVVGGGGGAPGHVGEVDGGGVVVGFEGAGGVEVAAAGAWRG